MPRENGNVRWIISLTVQYDVRHVFCLSGRYPDPCITARSLDPARFNALAPYALLPIVASKNIILTVNVQSPLLPLLFAVRGVPSVSFEM